MSTKIDLVHDMLRDHIESSDQTRARIEEDLREHKEGVQQNRTRIEKLEEAPKARKKIFEWAKWIITVSAALALIKEYIL